jgi:hypothetical protein
MKKMHLHCLISSGRKAVLKRYVELRRIRGYRISEGKVVEEGLEMLNLEERIKVEEKKLSRLPRGKNV